MSSYDREWDDETVSCKHDLRDQADEDFCVSAEQLRLLQEFGVSIPLRVREVVEVVERLKLELKGGW